MTQPDPFASSAPAAPQSAPPNPFGAVPAAPPAQPPAAPNPFPQQAPATAPANPFPAPQAYAAPQQAPAPFQQQAPPQGYAPAAPAPFQQQAPAPQAYAPPTAPPPVPQAAPQFDMSRFGAAPPPETGGGKGAQLADMYGRLVIVFPHSETTVPRRPEHITAEQRAAGNVNQQRLTATVVVLDQGPGQAPGGTIQWGGKPHALPPTPHTNSDPLPYVRKNMWINQTRLVGQARDYLPQTPGGAPGMMVGRVVKTGPEHNAPWYIAGATPEEFALAQTYINLVTQGHYPHPLAP